MKFNIEVIDCSKETRPTANGKGSYDILTVTFKNIGTGKIEAKKLVSFGSGVAAFNALEDAKKGATYEIESVKGEKYWEWTNAAKTVLTEADKAEAPKAASGGATAYKSNYETPEERAARQVMIVRQSSLANAVALLGPAHTPAEVLEVTQIFVDYCLNGQVKIKPAITDNFADMEDDIPL